MPFTAPLWKVATIGAGIVSLILVALLISASATNRDLTKQRSELSRQITDPKTGFVVRLAQAETNVETLKVQLLTQRKSFETKAAQRDKILAATEAELAKAQGETRAMQVKLNRFLATKPQGATLEDRVRDIDQRAMTELVE